MSEEQENQPAKAQGAEQSAESNALKLQGAYALKLGMSQIYDDEGRIIPVTVLKWQPWMVTQLKTKEKDGYSAVQIAAVPRKEKNTTKAELGHLKKSNAKAGFQFVREIRQDLPEGIEAGQEVSIETFTKGDQVKLTARSKGHGFAGTVKRWNFAGGPAAHGSKFHRAPGSVGNRTWPGRVIPGKKLPGQFGDETITVKNVQIVEVIPEENVLMVKGPVPGARNTLVRLIKQ